MNSKHDQWIDDIIGNSQPILPASETEETLIKLLIDYCYNNRNIAENNIGLLLASAFDLFVAMQYYSRLLHNGWLYCPSDDPRLFFHYTNCCPRHALKNEFHFHKSKKPQSGVIGTATAKILLLFFKYLFEYNGLEEQVLKGREPVDAIILNKAKKKVLFAEIKASPLMTPSVSMRSQKIMEDVNGESTESGHHDISNTGLFNSDLEICIPKFIDNHWCENYFPIGKRAGGKDTEWGMRGIINLINNDHTFYPQYFTFWKESLSAYYPKKTDSIYWLTNACGAPRPIPDDWAKRRSGSGYESISDSKTSVGMDRTDDIKKGIIRFLNLVQMANG